MRAINQGNIFTIYNNSLKTYDQLPAQVYNVRASKQSGFFLEMSAPIEIKESKIYGVHDAKCQKVLDAFRSFNRNLGVILSGDKGIGKSLFAKLLSIKSVEAGYPLLIIDTYIPGIASYIESIDQECVVMFDEFDKTFGEVDAKDGMASPQTELLSLFDGMAMGKKMFVVTCNDLKRLNEFLVNRPGRFHYHFRFEYPTPAEVTEYMQDKLPKEFWGEIKDVVSFSRKIKLNYDCLRAIAFELSNGVPFKDAIGDLNIVNIQREKYSVMLQYENGLIAHSNECWMDVFSDDQRTFWLCDKKGCDFVKVTFDPSSAQWNDRILGNIIMPDNIGIEYYDYDDSDKAEKALVEMALTTKPSYLLIKREYDKGIHYAV